MITNITKNLIDLIFNHNYAISMQTYANKFA